MLKNYAVYLNSWIGSLCKNAKTAGVVVGVSGGVDSAVVAAIAAINKKIKVLGVWMDIENSSLDRQCIHQLKKNKHFKIQEVDLLPIFNLYKRMLNLKTPAAINNLKARIRMVTLYALAQEHNFLVLGTGNADELYMGYFTKYGDGASDALPLAHLTKQNVFALARELKLPSIIINRAPSASLYEAQTDEEEMGVTYKDIDAFLKHQKIDRKSLKIIEQFHKNNHHKFHQPLKPKPFEKIKGL